MRAVLVATLLISVLGEARSENWVTPPTKRPPIEDAGELLRRRGNITDSQPVPTPWPVIASDADAAARRKADEFNASAARARSEADAIITAEGEATSLGSRLIFKRDGEVMEDPVRLLQGQTVVLSSRAPDGWNRYRDGRVLGLLKDEILMEFDDAILRVKNHPDQGRLKRGDVVSGWFYATGERSLHTAIVTGRPKTRLITFVDYGEVPSVATASAILEPKLSNIRQRVGNLRKRAMEYEAQAKDVLDQAKRQKQQRIQDLRNRLLAPSVP